MNLADPSERARWRAYLGEVLTGRKVIAGFGVLARFTDDVALYQAVGAKKPLLIASARGVGPIPGDDDAFICFFERDELESMTEEVRSRNAVARDLPDAVVRAVEEYDPDGEAVWDLDPFVENSPILGRQVYGGRPQAWMALEDKLVAEEVWEAIDAPRAPSLVVDVDLEAVKTASLEIDHGDGTVWTGDARDGINGGGDFVRWVQSDAEQRSAYDFFSTRCDKVRVMPFLEGVPCSIHGFVLADGTAAFRPMELSMLRIPATKRFVFGGMGTTWDPPAADREQMRELVRRTGEHLRARADYRGGFGIDGVLTKDGFRPTEINTRMSGGLNNLARILDVDALTMLQVNLVAGRDPAVTVPELERWALPALDATRMGKAVAITQKNTVEESRDIKVAWDGRSLTRADDGPLRITMGPMSPGTFAKIDSGSVLRKGDRLAPLNVALMQFLDAEFGSDFGPVETAPDVR